MSRPGNGRRGTDLRPPSAFGSGSDATLSRGPTPPQESNLQGKRGNSVLVGFVSALLGYSAQLLGVVACGGTGGHAAGGNCGRQRRGVDQAGFFVLNRVYAPSVLLETGFISNVQEEKLLKNKKYRKKVARSVYDAIKRFKAKYESN